MVNVLLEAFIYGKWLSWVIPSPNHLLMFKFKLGHSFIGTQAQARSKVIDGPESNLGHASIEKFPNLSQKAACLYNGLKIRSKLTKPEPRPKT